MSKYHVNVIVSRTSRLAEHAELEGHGNETGWFVCYSYAEARRMASRLFNMLTFLEGLREVCSLPQSMPQNHPRVSLSNSNRTIHVTIVRDGHLGEDELTLSMRKGTVK